MPVNNQIISAYDAFKEAYDAGGEFGMKDPVRLFQEVAIDNIVEIGATTTVDQKEIDRQRYRRIYPYKRNRQRLG